MTFSNRTSPGHQARTPTRRESASPFRPRDSGGGGPLELAQRANRGGGGAGRGASLSAQSHYSGGAASFTRTERASLMSAHYGNFRAALSPAPPPPPLRGGPPPPPLRGGPPPPLS